MVQLGPAFCFIMAKQVSLCASKQMETVSHSCQHFLQVIFGDLLAPTLSKLPLRNVFSIHLSSPLLKPSKLAALTMSSGNNSIGYLYAVRRYAFLHSKSFQLVSWTDVSPGVLKKEDKFFLPCSPCHPQFCTF